MNLYQKITQPKHEFIRYQSVPNPINIELIFLTEVIVEKRANIFPYSETGSLWNDN